VPTKRTRRAAPARQPLQSSMRVYLLTGDYDAARKAGIAAGEAGERGGFTGMRQLMVETLRHEALWADHADELLAEFIVAHPGRRPFGWWMYMATEPRRVVDARGARVAIPPAWDWCWKERFGVPACWPARLILVESEAVYLQRLLDGLTDREARTLSPADFEPVAIRAFPPEGGPE